MGLGDGGEGLLVGEVVVLGVQVAGDLLTGHAQLHQVCPDLDVAPDLLAHLVGAVGEGGDAFDQRAAGDRDFLRVGQVARPGDLSGVDGVADHHVQARLGRGGADAHGVAVVDVGQGRACREQRVFLDAHGAQPRQVRGVDPGEVGVGVAQAGHQELALTVDDAGVVTVDGFRLRGDLGDAAVHDEDLTGERVLPGGVEDADIGEQGGARAGGLSVGRHGSQFLSKICAAVGVASGARAGERRAASAPAPAVRGSVSRKW